MDVSYNENAQMGGNRKNQQILVVHRIPCGGAPVLISKFYTISNRNKLALIRLAAFKIRVVGGIIIGAVTVVANLSVRGRERRRRRRRQRDGELVDPEVRSYTSGTRILGVSVGGYPYPGAPTCVTVSIHI